jgi:hypothetical protein
VNTSVCLRLERSLRGTAGRGLPGGNSLSLASPRESKQREGDPGACVPSLRYGQPAVLGPGGVWLNSPSAQTTPALIRPALRSSAHSQGVGTGKQKTNTESDKDTPWRVLVVLVPAPACPVWLGRAAQMEAGSGPQLFERSEFCGPPPESSCAGCPKRSAGTQTSGRLFFGDFLLAKQKKVTCRRATPGQRHSALCPHIKTDAASDMPILGAGAAR